jgi:putative ABC transport system permease protein
LLLVEGLTIAAVGGVSAVAFAAAIQPVIRGLMPPIVPRADQIAIDPVVLAFALAITLVTAVVCGLTPAVLILRRDLLAAVRRSGITTTADRGVAFWRRFVMAVQVAVVLFLLVGAGLLLHSFWRIQNVPLGFDAADVITMEVRLLSARYRQAANLAAFQEALVARVRAIPGVALAGLTTAVPMRGTDYFMRLGPRGGAEKNGHMRSVDPDYFRIMGIPIQRGRGFLPTDVSGGQPVVVVSEAFARQFFGEADPLGRTIAVDEQQDTTIVGVVGDTRYAGVTSNPSPAFYVPRAQRPNELMCVIVQPQPGASEAVAAALRSVVQEIDPEQPAEGITTIGQIVSQSTADRRFYAIATGAFAAVALLLAVAGLFGVVSRSVSERRRELAIRTALGADPNALLRLVVGYGLVPVAAGTLAGLTGAFAAARLLESLLFQVTPADPLTYVGSAIVVLAMAALACVVPAARALRVPPMLVLKGN